MKNQEYNKLIKWLILFGLSILVLGLLSCETEPYEPACTQGEYVHGSICTEEYQPVCSPDGTTYANLCYAIKDGWEERCVVEGECN